MRTTTADRREDYPHHKMSVAQIVVSNDEDSGCGLVPATIVDMPEKKHLLDHCRLFRLCALGRKSLLTRETICQKQSSKIDDETIHQIRVAHLDSRIMRMTGVSSDVKDNGIHRKGKTTMMLQEEGGTTLRDSGIGMMRDCTRMITTTHETDARRDRTIRIVLDKTGTRTYDELTATSWQPVQKQHSPQVAQLMESTLSGKTVMIKSDVVHQKEIQEIMTGDAIGMLNVSPKDRRKEKQESLKGIWMHVLKRQDLLDLRKTREVQDQHWSRTHQSSHDNAVM